MNHGEEKIVLASVAFVVSTFDFNIDAAFPLISSATSKRWMDHLYVYLQ